MVMAGSTALIILAAGSSSRLGQAKQQLVFQGSSLLQRAITAGLRSECMRPLVILGARHEILSREINPEQVDILINPNWQEGMATSIKVGIQRLMEKGAADQVILMLCDQPYVDEKILNQLIAAKKKTDKAIIACSYQNTAGVPALFDRSIFPHLMQLKGKEGAKKIIQRYGESLSLLPFPLGRFDIDTPDDYRRLLQKK